MGKGTASAALLVILFGGVLAGGLRDPFVWTAAGVLLWAVAFTMPKGAAELRWWAPWLVWGLLSAVTGLQPLKALLPWTRWLGVLLFFSLARAQWGKEDDRERWFRGFCLAGFVLALAALFLVGDNAQGIWGALDGRGQELKGLIPPHYNYTIFALAALAAALVAYLGHRGARRPRSLPTWALGGLLLLVMAVILLSRSRGGLVAVGAGVAVFLWRRGRIKWGWMPAAILAALLLFIKFGGLEHFFGKDRIGSYNRPQIWSSALRVVGENPFFGEGPGGFHTGFLRNNFPSGLAVRYGFSTNHAHSEFLEIAAVTGWVGLALFLAALFGGFGWPRRGMASPAQEAALCAFAAMTAQCLFDNMLHLPGLGMLYFSSLAIGLKSSDTPQAASRGSWRLLCLAGLCLTGLAWLPEAAVERAQAEFGSEPDPQKRLQLVRRAVSVFPEDYYLHEILGREWLAQKPIHPEKSYSEFLKAWSLNPTNALYPAMLADVRRVQGRDAEAMILLDEALRIEPFFLSARLSKAGIWIKEGSIGRARRELEDVSRRSQETKNDPRHGGYERAILSFDGDRFRRLKRKLRKRESGK